MYNEDIKTKFLSLAAKSAQSLKIYVAFFGMCEPYEKKYDKDICQMSDAQASEVLRNVSGMRTSSISSRLSMFREYIRWCCDSGAIENANHELLDLKMQETTSMKKSMVSGPTHLQMYLDAIFDKESENTTDILRRCYCWLVFSGLSDEQIENLSKDGVNFLRMEILETYPIYRESIVSIESACNSIGFIYKHPLYEPVMRDRVGGSQIMRGVRGGVGLSSIRNEISRKTRDAIKNGSDIPSLSINRIRLSGIFYRVYEMERAGVIPNFRKNAIDDASASVSVSDTKKYNSYVNTKTYCYLRDYKQWKVAFER